jgi:hypothetical protein
LTKFRIYFGAAGALMLFVMPSSAMSARTAVAKAPAAHAKKAPAPDDVPAPPIALLFGIGAVGLIWGRRLAANARKKQEQAKID